MYSISTNLKVSQDLFYNLFTYILALELEDRDRDQQEKTSKTSAKKKQKEKEVSPVPEIEEESTPVPRRSRASGKAESNQADSANENSSGKKVVKRSVEFFKLKFLKAMEDITFKEELDALYWKHYQKRFMI